jgi:hypothetical protein
MLLQALSVGIFPYVLKLLPTSAIELRQILVFIWTKILSLDKVCIFYSWNLLEFFSSFNIQVFTLYRFSSNDSHARLTWLKMEGMHILSGFWTVWMLSQSSVRWLCSF